MPKIVLARIDDRLIHGQTTTRWISKSNANRVVIVDDTFSNGVFMLRIFRSMISPEVALDILTEKAATDYFRNDESDDAVFVLAKSPIVFAHLLDNGVALDAVNIGCMGKMPKRKNIFYDIYATDDEAHALKHLKENGVRMNYQVLPGNCAEIL